ncbi:MAG: hypothetical protein V2J12_02535 [Gammaproteobacteria bacterium]|jgi:hypothetical protein|nr:hypothetical protein [Gammaproteobacteria bacterium]
MAPRSAIARTLGILMLLGNLSAASGPAQAQQLPGVAAKDFAKDDFSFPDDIDGPGPHLLFLGMAVDKDNGAEQGEALLVWFKALTADGLVPGAARPWHFSVIEGVPFFAKGFVRSGIAKTYGGLLPPSQGVVLFVDDVRAFAAAAGLTLDGQPRIVVYTPERGIIEVFTGAYTPERGAALAAVLAALPGPAAAVD